MSIKVIKVFEFDLFILLAHSRKMSHVKLTIMIFEFDLFITLLDFEVNYNLKLILFILFNMLVNSRNSIS